MGADPRRRGRRRRAGDPARARRRARGRSPPPRPAAKLEIARGHGAEHAFLADPETLAAQVREATDGHGVDVVVDGVNGPLVAPSMQALGFHGRYVVAGAASQAAGRSTPAA